jgi:predicted deacylase
MVMEIQGKIERGEKVGVINENGEPNSDIDLREGTQSYIIEFESKKITK